MRFVYNKASLLLAPVGKHGFILSNLYSRDRGKGEGTKVLQMALDYVDTQGGEVMLWAQQFGDIHGLRDQELISWYERFGFIPTSGKIKGRQMMIRPPSQKKHAL